MCPCLASTKWWTLLRPHLGGMGLATTFVFQGLMFPVLLEDLINLILICHVFECTDASVCVRVSECFSLQDTVCKFGLMPVCNRPICTIYSTPRRDGVLGFFVEPKVHNLHDLKNYSHSCHQYAWMHPENSNKDDSGKKTTPSVTYLTCLAGCETPTVINQRGCSDSM